jgi:hypothetical protein
MTAGGPLRAWWLRERERRGGAWGEIPADIKNDFQAGTPCAGNQTPASATARQDGWLCVAGCSPPTPFDNCDIGARTKRAVSAHARSS